MNGNPAQEAPIPDEEVLYLRVFPSPSALVYIPGNGDRPNSSAFRTKSDADGVSVDLGSLSTPHETLARAPHPYFHVARITAKEIRDTGCRLVRDPIGENDPLGDPPNPAHALILGAEKTLLTGTERKNLANKARIELYAQPQPVGDEQEPS